MEKEIDIITLCERLIELTDQEKCSWKETSENDRYRLRLTSGVVEIHHVKSEILNPLSFEIYDISLFDSKGERYATYKATSQEKNYNVYKRLYKSVEDFLEKSIRRKIAFLYDDLKDK